MKLDDYSLTELNNAVSRKLGANPIEEFLSLFSEVTRDYLETHVFYGFRNTRYKDSDLRNNLSFVMTTVDHLRRWISDDTIPDHHEVKQHFTKIYQEYLRVLSDSYANYQLALKAQEYYQYLFIKHLKAEGAI